MDVIAFRIAQSGLVVDGTTAAAPFLLDRIFAQKSHFTQ